MTSPDDSSKPEYAPQESVRPVRRPERATNGLRRSGAASQANGDETRARIIAAALETLNTQGIVGASARAIARQGDFNQALIFYHFGSVEGLMIAAAKSEGIARSERYRASFSEVTTIAELVSIARAVHHEEQTSGSVNVLSQLLAGSFSAPELQRGLHETMTPWMSLVEDAVRRVLGDSALQSLLPVADVTFAISSLFLGLELMSTLDPSGEQATRLFDTVERLSSIFELMLGATRSMDSLPKPSQG